MTLGKINIRFTGMWILLLFVLAGCQTVDFPEPSSPELSEPQFLFDGMVGGEPINWAAGESNYFMHTDYARDQNGVYNFTGHLKQDDCTDPCPNSLMLKIKDVGISTSPSVVNINEALKVGTLDYTNEHVEDSVRITFRANGLDRETFNYNFTIGDRTLDPHSASQVNAATTTIALTKLNEATHLAINGKHKENLFSFTLAQPLFSVNAERRKRLKIKVRINGQKLLIMLTATPESQDQTISWSNGSDRINLELDELPTRPLTAQVKYADGQSAFFSIHFSEDAKLNRLNLELPISFDFNTVEVKAANAKQFRTTEIIYFNQNGTAYSSLKTRQNDDSKFIIKTSEEFLQTNAAGDRTRKIRFEIKTLLGNENGQILEFEGSGTFALAYPG